MEPAGAVRHGPSAKRLMQGRSRSINEEQHRRPLRSRGETAFDRVHPAGIWAATPNNVNPAEGVAPTEFYALKTSDGTCRLASSLDSQFRRGRGSNGALRSQAAHGAG
jgi:hypothetical protein